MTLAYLVYRVTFGVLDLTSCTNLEAYWYFFQYFSATGDVTRVLCDYIEPKILTSEQNLWRTWKIVIAANQNVLWRSRRAVQHGEALPIVGLVYRHLQERTTGFIQLRRPRSCDQPVWVHLPRSRRGKSEELLWPSLGRSGSSAAPCKLHPCPGCSPDAQTFRRQYLREHFK